LSTNLFIPQQVYRRSDIHDKFGGNRQGGISASALYPYIFIFSGKSGQQHGYKDQWENENVFSYTGEGQINDMKFTKGNLALRDHLKNGKAVFLFTQEEKAFVRFNDELQLVDFDFFIGNDRIGNPRVAIKFFLKKVGKELGYEPEYSSISLVGDKDRILECNVPNITERKGLITSRVGQGAYRKSILYRWNYRCAVTNYSKKEILIASHIVAWKDSSDKERLDVDNGILLSPVYDALFDQNLISFADNGNIILSTLLSSTTYQDIGITGHEVIKNFTPNNLKYLQRHRQKLI
jgi:5-methylcytosine-specific restriction protein A